MEGLKPNLISIGQLCDLELNVNFTKTKCLVLDQKQGEVMQGKRSFDNCYLWTPDQIKESPKCLLSRAETTKLWHRKLGHLNLRSMQKAISENSIVGIPDLKIVEGKICGECQIGKQTRKSHKRLQHISSSRVLELFHVDLMGPMQTESLGGTRYVFVCVDDYSRYTWVDFVREKSDTFDVFKKTLLASPTRERRHNWQDC